MRDQNIFNLHSYNGWNLENYQEKMVV